MKESTEIILDMISREIQNCQYTPEEIDFALKNTIEPTDDENTEIIYEAARCIVEPRIYDRTVEDDYIEFQESNPDNWANFIRSNFGEIWGEVAEFINENGY